MDYIIMWASIVLFAGYLIWAGLVVYDGYRRDKLHRRMAEMVRRERGR